MWGHSVDERKLNRGGDSHGNPLHRSDAEPGADRLHGDYPTEEVEDPDASNVTGTWGERDVGGFNETRAKGQYVSLEPTLTHITTVHIRNQQS